MFFHGNHQNEILIYDIAVGGNFDRSQISWSMLAGHTLLQHEILKTKFRQFLINAA